MEFTFMAKRTGVAKNSGAKGEQRAYHKANSHSGGV